jgi:membrane protein DedA with SNARE-associated domain
VEEFLKSWGYLGIFLGILATGIGFPMPEELPIVVGGGLAGSTAGEGENKILWWIMLPVCILGVVIGDTLLYGIGRLWGRRLLQYHWVKKRLLPPERLESIERNFHQYGIQILLFARLTPGIRAPIFFTAGFTRLALIRFILADAVYAVPGVSLLFFLGYWFAGNLVNLLKDVEHVKSILVLAAILAVAGYFLYRYLRRPVVTGNPTDVPKLVEQVTHTLEQATTRIIHPLSKGQADAAAAEDGKPRKHDGQPEHREKATEEKKDQA